jgi:hypothetical protein
METFTLALAKLPVGPGLLPEPLNLIGTSNLCVYVGNPGNDILNSDMGSSAGVDYSDRRIGRGRFGLLEVASEGLT